MPLRRNVFLNLHQSKARAGYRVTDRQILNIKNSLRAEDYRALQETINNLIADGLLQQSADGSLRLTEKGEICLRVNY